MSQRAWWLINIYCFWRLRNTSRCTAVPNCRNLGRHGFPNPQSYATNSRQWGADPFLLLRNMCLLDYASYFINKTLGWRNQASDFVFLKNDVVNIVSGLPHIKNTRKKAPGISRYDSGVNKVQAQHLYNTRMLPGFYIVVDENALAA